MNSPAAPKPSLGVTAFHDLVDQALRESVGVRETAAHALLLGVVPDEIVAYVRRTLPHHAREEVTAQAARVPWVMGRIVALVKARRNPRFITLTVKCFKFEHSVACGEIKISVCAGSSSLSA